MSWEKTLDHYGVLVEERLRDYLGEAVKEAKDYHPFIGKVYSTLEEFVFRKGKRLASCSTLLTYQGYTNRVDDPILKVSAGIELYRHCILIHDDLVDRDDLRRGEKTIHRMFSEERNERFGEGVAVFLGDIAYALAIEVILNSRFEEDKLARILSILSERYREVNESQILDLLFEGKEVDADEWHIMASKRAASLFRITMLIGAILGGAPEEDLEILEEVAVNIGYAFDIQDDIIDTYASEDQYGRPPCGDLILSKKPLHVVCALGSKNREESEALKGLLGKKLRAEETEQAKMIIKDSGGLEAAKETSKAHAEKAKALIANTGLNKETKRFFTSFIDYIEESLDWYK